MGVPNGSLAKVIPQLFPFAGRADDDSGLPFSMNDYLELVDWSGRAILPHKRGSIVAATPPILPKSRDTHTP
jgi:putative transposase